MSGFYSVVQSAGGGQRPSYPGDGSLPAGIVGTLCRKENINFTTADKFRIMGCPKTGAAIVGVVGWVDTADTVSVVPQLKIYVADANGNPVTTIIDGTPATGCGTALEAFFELFAGARTYSMTEGQTIWGEITVGATAAAMTGAIDVIGYIRN